MSAKAPEVQRATGLAKLLYQPVGRLGGLVAGLIAGEVFRRVWRRIAPGNHEKAPSALQSEYPLREVFVAATLQGAITGGVKALIDRGGARAFQRWIGEWPGE